MTLGKIVIDEDMLERVMRKVMREIAGEMKVATVTKSSPTAEENLTASDGEIKSTAEGTGTSYGTELEQSNEASGEKQAEEVEALKRELRELQEKHTTTQENYNELRNMFRSINKEKNEWEERYNQLKDDYVVIHEEQNEVHEYIDSLVDTYDMKGEESMGLLDTIRCLFNSQNDVLQETVKESSQQISDLSYEISQLKTNLTHKAEELDHWKEKALDSEDKCKSLETDCQQLRKDKGELETTCKNYKKDNKALQEKLKISFEKGQQLFARVQALPESYKNYIEAEVQLSDLESFIISSTMTFRVLERIWMATKDAAVADDADSFNVLWAYFEYACELFNKGRGSEIIVIDTVEVGAPYNVHDYDAVSGSASRGDIQKIYIRGFKNVYEGKSVAKTLVRV